MAREVKINIDAIYQDTEGANPQTVPFSVKDLFVNVSGKRPASFKMNANTSIEIIPLADITTAAGGLFAAQNLDTTNYVEIHTSTSSGIVIGKMGPGESYGPVRWGSSVTAPAIVANTATCQVQVWMTPP